ncbi:MAG: trypsin-like peptidase domain-containing protein [Elusimicrobiota bacterium]
MTTILLTSAALLLSCAASAQDKAPAEALSSFAEHLRSTDQEVIVRERVADGWGNACVLPRERALQSVYQELAAENYRQSVEAGLSGAQADEAKAGIQRMDQRQERVFKDAKTLKIDPKGLIPVDDCPLPCCVVVRLRCECACADGGKAPLASESRLAGLQDSLVKASRAGSAAERLYAAGRVFERMAEAAPPAPRARLTPQQIYREKGSGVVLVICGDETQAMELGTGSIIDPDGVVLTNAHVVLRPSDDKPFELIRVYLKPKRITGDPEKDLAKPLEAELLSYDKDLDLAILKLSEKPGSAASIPLGDSDAMEPGDPVVAIGHPEQGGLWTLTKGVVSTVVADLGGIKGKDAFQTDASINRGNSGGPLLDEGGSLVGVNTCMARKAADGLAITAVNFSVKSDVVKRWLASANVPVRYETAGAVAVEETKPVEAKPEEPKPAAQPPVEVPEPKPEPPPQLKPAEPKPEAPKPVETPPARKEEPNAAGAAVPEPQKPEPTAVQPQAVKPEPKPEPPPQVKPAESKPQILTPVKPYSRQDMLKAAMKEMEDLMDDMRGEIQRRRKGR